MTTSTNLRDKGMYLYVGKVRPAMKDKTDDGKKFYSYPSCIQTSHLDSMPLSKFLFFQKLSLHLESYKKTLQVHRPFSNGLDILCRFYKYPKYISSPSQMLYYLLESLNWNATFRFA